MAEGDALRELPPLVVTVHDLAPGALIKVGARDSSLSALSNGDSVSIGVSDADPSQATSVRINTAQ